MTIERQPPTSTSRPWTSSLAQVASMVDTIYVAQWPPLVRALVADDLTNDALDALTTSLLSDYLILKGEMLAALRAALGDAPTIQ